MFGLSPNRYGSELLFQSKPLVWTTVLHGFTLLGARFRRSAGWTAEVRLGVAIVGLINAMGPHEGVARKIFSSAGIKKLDPNAWYSILISIEIYDLFIKLVGEHTLFDIGLGVPGSVPWPPAIQDIDSALRSLDVAYHMNHRIRGEVMFNPATGVMLEGIGHYRCERVGRRKMLVISDTPYPTAFELGIIAGTARKFDPAAEVELDPNRPSRKQGGDSCTFVVTW